MATHNHGTLGYSLTGTAATTEVATTSAGEEIWEVLAREGVVRTRGKAMCPRCNTKKLSVTTFKGFAKCWGCGAFWSCSSDKTAPADDWVIFMIGSIGEACQDSLPHDRDALDWLEHRKLPVDDTDWLLDQDLGAVPSDIDITTITRKAGKMLAEESKRRLAAATEMVRTAKAKGAKACKAAEAKLEALNLELDVESVNFDHIVDNILPLLTTAKWDSALVYIYRDQDGQPCSLNIRQYGTEPNERTVMRIQPRPGRRGVFGALDAQYDAGDSWSGDMPPLVIVEGEHNLLSLRALTDKWNKDYAFYVPVIAVGGKDGADVKCIQALVGDREPLVIYDNDKVNPATGMPGGFAVVNAVADRMYCHATTTPTKDLDDYIKGAEGLTSSKLLQEVFERAERVSLNINAVRSGVEALLRDKGIEANAKEIAVSTLIIADLLRRTTIYNVDDYAMLLLPGGNMVPVRKGEPRYQEFIGQYGIAHTSWLDAVGKAINIEATKLSTPRRSLKSLSTWVDGTLYINCYEGTMVRISIEGDRPVLARVPNGTDGILMQRYAHSAGDNLAKVQPWLPEAFDLSSISPGGLRLVPGSELDTAVLSTVNYAKAPDDYKQLFKCWLISTFFAATQKSKPVPMFEGTGGSGKTSVGVKWGTVLIGEHFTATNTPTTGKELAELMSGKPYVVFDEWNNVSKEVESTFKSLTTGVPHSRRELYTTAQVVTLPCDASIVLTSNANPTKQVATGRRMFVIPVAPRQDALGDKVFQSMGDYLIPALMAQRGTIWRELLADLTACVIALNKTNPDTKTSLSMADFGVFVQRVASYEGWSDEADRLFVQVATQQEQQTADTQMLAELLPQVFEFAPDLQGKFLTATEWVAHYQAVLGNFELERKGKINTNYVGYVFKTFSDLFTRCFGLEVEEDKHKKIKRYAMSMQKSSSVIVMRGDSKEEAA